MIQGRQFDILHLYEQHHKMIVYCLTELHYFSTATFKSYQVMYTDRILMYIMCVSSYYLVVVEVVHKIRIKGKN